MKFMQVCRPEQARQLLKLAKERGVTIQELLRVLIIPDWLIQQKTLKANKWKRKVSVHARKVPGTPAL